MIDRLRALSERDRRTFDRLFVAGVLVMAEVEVLTSRETEDPLWLSAVVVALMALALLVRRSRPLPALLAVVVLGAAGFAVATGPADSALQVFILIAANYACGAYASGRTALAGAALGVGGIFVVAAVASPGDILFPVVFFGFLPWLLGRMFHNQTVLARELAERAELAEHASKLEERRSVEDERARIARELHDVLAHNLSVMVIQASAAQRVVHDDPERAAQAAELIRRTGREALSELRYLLGPVRRQEGRPLSGSPGLGELERLAERARRAGLPVELRVEGDPVPLAAGTESTAFRVVQEGLTNAIKHAGAARATITVRYEPTELVVEVEDDGLGPGGGGGQLSAAGGGHGLVGMRERVELYGGVLEAGRRRRGGYAVRARLPTAPVREAVA